MKHFSRFMAVVLAVVLMVPLAVLSGSADEQIPSSAYSFNSDAVEAEYDALDVLITKLENAEQKNIDIYTADQLAALAIWVNANDSGLREYTVLLHSDLVYNTGDATTWGESAPSYQWIPIGNAKAFAFQGTFDGQGHTVSGLYIDVTGNGALFGYLNGAVVRNVGVINSYIKVGTGGYGAAIVAAMYTSSSTVSGCYSDATVYSGGYGNGGIVALVNTADCVIERCAFNGTVTGSATSSTSAGILGVANSANNASVTVNDCVNTGEIYTGKTRSAGLVAYAVTVTMNRCYNAGKVTSEKKDADTEAYVFNGSQFFGTIVNNANTAVIMSDCYYLSDLEDVKEFGEDKTASAAYTAGFSAYYTALTAAQAKGISAATAMSKLDFTDVWGTVADGYALPKAVLTIQNGVANEKVPVIDTDGGNETEEITTPANPETDAKETVVTTGEPDTTVTTTEKPEATKGGCKSAVLSFTFTGMVCLAGMTVLLRKKKED